MQAKSMDFTAIGTETPRQRQTPTLARFGHKLIVIALIVLLGAGVDLVNPKFLTDFEDYVLALSGLEALEFRTNFVSAGSQVRGVIRS